MTPSAITPRTHPFRFLLHLEWGLLALAIMMELAGPLRGVVTRSPLLPIIPIVLFGAMGLWLPTENTLCKWGHTLAQVGLIALGPFVFAGHAFPFPHLILVIRSALMFQMRGRLLATAIAFGLFISIVIQRLGHTGQRLGRSLIESPELWQFSQRMFTAFTITFSVLFALSLLMILLLMNALLAERQSREELVNANEKLRTYALRIESLAMEQERNRIARDIHDSLGHSLTALNLQIEGALKLATLRPEQSLAFLQDAKRLGSTALNDVRQSVATLRTHPLQGKSLAEAVETLAQDFCRTTQIQPQLSLELDGEPPMELATPLYRIIQEALTNICKHAEAEAVTVTLTQNATVLDLHITDNGKGFDRSSSQHSGFGLQGMRERIIALEGQFRIESQPGHGCQIRAWIPTTPPGSRPDVDSASDAGSRSTSGVVPDSMSEL